MTKEARIGVKELLRKCDRQGTGDRIKTESKYTSHGKHTHTHRHTDTHTHTHTHTNEEILSDIHRLLEHTF